jgi:glycine/serine hydroxymethyltransferase
MVIIAKLIDKVLSNPEDLNVLNTVKEEVVSLCEKDPLNY